MGEQDGKPNIEIIADDPQLTSYVVKSSIKFQVGVTVAIAIVAAILTYKTGSADNVAVGSLITLATGLGMEYKTK